MINLRERQTDLDEVIKELETKGITVTVQEQNAEWIAEVFATKCQNWWSRCAACSSCQKCRTSEDDLKNVA